MKIIALLLVVSMTGIIIGTVLNILFWLFVWANDITILIDITDFEFNELDLII